MTKVERARLMEQWFRDHNAEWTAYLAKPVAERTADQDKVEAAYRLYGVQAARDMARALGQPSPPDEICDPVEELEAKRTAGSDADEAAWMREATAEFGVSDLEIEEMLAPTPARRMDH